MLKSLYWIHINDDLLYHLLLKLQAYALFSLIDKV